MTDFNYGDRVRIKEGTKDPDVPEYDIGGQIGTVVDCNDGYIEIEIDECFINDMPEWVKEKLDAQTLDFISLEERCFEHVNKQMQSPTELDQAVKIIEGLIDAINVMPICWDEFVGQERADKTISFLAKHNPYRWSGWLEDEDE